MVITCDRIIYIQHVCIQCTLLEHLPKADWLAIYMYLQLCTLFLIHMHTSCCVTQISFIRIIGVSV